MKPGRTTRKIRRERGDQIRRTIEERASERGIGAVYAEMPLACFHDSSMRGTGP
jgi:hypothetical protein